MAITINGKTYRNLQEQVEENVKDIEDLQDNQFSGNYNDLENKPDLSVYETKAEAFSGNYNDLTNKPNLATVATTGYYYDLKWKPNLATVATTGVYNDLTGKPTIPPTVSGTNNGGNWTSITIGSDTYNIPQTAGISAGTGIDITNSVISVDNSVLTTSTAAEVAMTGSYNDLNNTPNLAAVATSGAYNDLTGKPNLATVATTGNYSDLIGKPNEHTYYCTMKIVTTDSKTYVFSKYFTTTEAVLPSSGHNWYGTDMLKYIRYGGSVWFCQTTADGTNIPVQTLVYTDYMEDVGSYRFRAYNNSGYRNDFVLNISQCNVYLDEL